MGARKSRKKGTDAWLAQSLDKDGFQARTLAIAFALSEDPAQKLTICKQFRSTGKQHPHLPLLPISTRPCTDMGCHCEPHYKILAGMDGGIGTSSTDFVREGAL